MSWWHRANYRVFQQNWPKPCKKYLNLEAELHKRVIGQDQAVQYQWYSTQSIEGSVATSVDRFFHVPRTAGVGKTELAKALAVHLMMNQPSSVLIWWIHGKNSPSARLRLPPGYMGYEEGGRSWRESHNKPYSVLLLFDGVEKAHPDIFNVLCKSWMTSLNRWAEIDFSNTIIIMTSNHRTTAHQDDKTVNFGAKDIPHDQANMETHVWRNLKKTYRQSLSTGLMKR